MPLKAGGWASPWGALALRPALGDRLPPHPAASQKGRVGVCTGDSSAQSTYQCIRSERVTLPGISHGWSAAASVA